MSCSSVKHRFDQLKSQGGINFNEAVNRLFGSTEKIGRTKKQRKLRPVGLIFLSSYREYMLCKYV